MLLGWAAMLPLLGSPSSAAPVVIELFTAQGCSSCPPADKLLSEVAHQPDVIALAYHVDYWDGLGWKDRFSLPEATGRQRGYVRKLSRSGVFTPQAVIGGATSFIGSDRVSMNKALAEDRDALAVVLSKDKNTLKIDFKEQWHEQMDIYLISYLAAATTQVGCGENANRVLKEVNIVRSFRRLGTWNGEPQQRSVPLTIFPRDATNVVVLLQKPNQGAIAGAAALPLR
jgi:hypothetical protein